jgi:hypothetical protein
LDELMSKKTEDSDILQEAKKRFQACEDWEADFRKRFVEDLKFANADPENGWQWDQVLQQNRTDKRKPCLTINKTRQHNLQIINDAKQNKPGVNIRPVGDGATYEAAQVFEGVVRHIEYQSNAEQAYDTATTFQVEGGIGYWRVITDYVSPDTFDQEIYIRRIKNPDTVYLDPDISEADGSDARFGFIFEDMSRDRFEAEYPDFKGDADLDVIGKGDSWCAKDSVRIAEYYRREQKADKLVAFVDPMTQQQVIIRKSVMDDNQKAMYELVKADPSTNERSVLTDEVQWFKIAGNKIIDRRVWPGKFVPIVRVIGEETVIEGKMDRKGHTRALKDAQRMYNYWPLSLDTPIPTPTGWTKMGDIQVGDAILDDAGKPTLVKGMSDVFLDRKCFKVVFDDGSHIIADAEHPWIVEERGKRKAAGHEWSKRKLTTEELIPNAHFIQTALPLDLPAVDLVVDPYVLGVWLGDGRSDGGEVTASIEDEPGMTAALRACGVDAGPAKPSSTAMRIPIYGLVGDLRKAGVFGNKHIPTGYLRASYDQRLALLQGLMDTDGNVNRATLQCSFDNTNPVLMAGVVELIRSLGIKAFVKKLGGRTHKFPSGKTYECSPSERVTFSTDLPVFRMERKALILNCGRKQHPRRTKRHAIRDVIEVPSVPVRCVSIDSPSHLFLAGPSMVPTHNTSEGTAQVALQTQTPYIAAVEATEGLETYWAKSNLDDAAYLPYNAYAEDGTRTIPPPQRTQPPQMASAYIDGMRICENQLMMASGQYQSQFGQNENATSGKAINERQRQGDNATYHYIDNLAIGIKYTGKILIDLIPKIYDTPRVIRILAKDGTEGAVQIDPNARQAHQPTQDPNQEPDENQTVSAIFNPNVGRYEIESDTGPGYATRRQEAFNAMTQIAAQDKGFLEKAGDLYWKAADFPMADELAERYANTIPAAVKGKGPPPEVQRLQGQLQQAQDAIAKLTQQLNDKEKEINIKAFDSESKRITAIGNSGPAITPDQIQPLIRQTLIEILTGGPPEGGQGQQMPAEQPQAPQQPPMGQPMPMQPGMQQ